MLLMLAALAHAQAPSLEVQPRDMPVLCGAALGVSTTEPGVRQMAEMLYFIVAAIRADPREALFRDRISETMAAMQAAQGQFAEGGAMAGRAPDLLAECDQRFPLARSEAPAPLPRDPSSHDELCFGMLSSLRPLVRDIDPDGDPTLAAVEQAQDAYDRRIVERALQTTDQPEPVSDESMTAEMIAALEFGNARAIGQACIADLGGSER